MSKVKSTETKTKVPKTFQMERLELYTGTKTVKAMPLTLGEYNKLRGWKIPKGENPADPGWLVGYSNAQGEFNGEEVGGCHHISWSPDDVFKAAYKENWLGGKTLHNSDVSGARVNVKDIQVVGNGDMFQLLCKASSEKEGWMKSTKAMALGNGCLVQVTTQQRNPDGSYAIAEALAFVPGSIVCNDINNGRKVVMKHAS